MKRSTLALVLLSLATLAPASLEAGQPRAKQAPRKRASWVEYKPIVRNGQMTAQKTWNGNRAFFPEPAFLYYGSPHSYDATGIGF